MWFRHMLHTPKGQERRGGQHKTTSASGTRTSWPSLTCSSACPSAWYGRPPMLTYYLPSSFPCPFRLPVPPPARPPTSRPPHTCPGPDPLVPATFTPSHRPHTSSRHTDVPRSHRGTFCYRNLSPSPRHRIGSIGWSTRLMQRHQAHLQQLERQQPPHKLLWH